MPDVLVQISDEDSTWVMLVDKVTEPSVRIEVRRAASFSQRYQALRRIEEISRTRCWFDDDLFIKNSSSNTSTFSFKNYIKFRLTSLYIFCNPG